MSFLSFIPSVECDFFSLPVFDRLDSFSSSFVAALKGGFFRFSRFHVELCSGPDKGYSSCTEQVENLFFFFFTAFFSSSKNFSQFSPPN